ncbi:SGT1-domain-containing protein [Pleurostoma richardsiae]|uniref:SGT1-domain-containing protein n=1 Tax=Pleurostoma richardsiae TaxID=41990 RepID=A0AA38VC31_9PEZI|nr:SGT1-domain-containing protein [Pleurostoma richardsiae]
MLFIIDGQLDSRKLLSSLECVRKAAMHLADQLTKDYIWQRDCFSLETKSEKGVTFLHGTTEYGDSIEDEWLIVYILRELSKQFPTLWVRVADSDGEFLLVEAAQVAPRWLNPELDKHRVWIHEGRLCIIPLSPGVDAPGKNLGLPEALEVLKSSPDLLIHSAFLEAEAFYRLEKYPAHINQAIHCAKVTIPRKLAYILHQRPKAIAPAIEAFYLRDPIAMKPLLSPSSDGLEFPPVDLVTVSVRFTRVLFAQIKSQRFPAPPTWKDIMQCAEEGVPNSPRGYKRRAMLELGMKVACGFEMLVARASKSNSRLVREVALLLEDLEEDGDQVLPSDVDIGTWKDVGRDDDDSWMDIDYNDLDQELNGRGGKRKEDDSGNANAQADLRKIVSRFEAFLNDEEAGIDGAEFDEMDQDDDDSNGSETEDSEFEDKEVSFDEQEFARMMREMMGIPSEVAEPPRRAEADESRKPPHSGGDHVDEDAEIRKLAEQMGAELEEHGALALEPAAEKPAAIGTSRSGPPLESPEEEESSNEERGFNIDYNLAKNILESFKGQAGDSGPASSILNILGMSLPRDEDQEDEDG